MVRLCGVLLAAALAVVTAVALSAARVGALLLFGSGSMDAAQFSATSVFAACSTALLLSTRVRDGRLHGVRAVSAMAALTYFVGVMLFPVVATAAAWPKVSNGGAIPCTDIQIIGTEHTTCAAGLYGVEALRALIGATLSLYQFTAVALVLFVPLLIVLVVPSVVWVLLMRFGEVDAYQRSV